MSGPLRPLPPLPGGPGDALTDAEADEGPEAEADDGAPATEPGDTAEGPGDADELEADVLNDDLGPLVADPSASVETSDPDPGDEDADVTGTPLSDAEIDALAAAEDAAPGG
ncbi:MAG TPA: hypothetical protein VES19_13845 [Candidatus Limnocylindrales bacterium]|nr:hypothetical protein [Candidatus Limnocylindrales bacterium]